VVTHGESGHLSPVGDIDDMAEAGVELLCDADRWARASAAARAGSERYSAVNVVPMYEACYEEVLRS
jgi:glycosyltransferase involved in cell wall biosynthesis